MRLFHATSLVSLGLPDIQHARSNTNALVFRMIIILWHVKTGFVAADPSWDSMEQQRMSLSAVVSLHTRYTGKSTLTVSN